jgi:hypothetical protein
MAENRTPRDLVTREKTARAVYVPPSALPDPTPEPGWRYRWIATTVNGQSYAQNVARRMREGWVPVRAEDHPELMLPANASGNVEVGGLMLCKAPVEMVEARSAYYQQQSERQIESVDNTLMRQSDARMPLFNERKSTTTFGKGNK